MKPDLRTMKMQTMKKGLVAFALSMTVSPACAGTGAFDAEGYWIDNDVEGYERYVRIENDSGYYCVLDGKSGFTFKVVGDSITTPMNGMNHILAFPGSGNLKISGEEKGEPYSTLFHPLAPKDYPKECADLEKEFSGTTGIAAGPAPKPTPHAGYRGRAARNLLGRIVSGR
jgi:hypothetical protein